MRVISKRSWFVLAAAIYAMSGVAAIEASRGYSTEWTFFSDSSQTEIVGEGYTSCSWSFTMWWGTQSEYYSGFDTGCGGGGGWQYCPNGCPTGWVCTIWGCTVPGAP